MALRTCLHTVTAPVAKTKVNENSQSDQSSSSSGEEDDNYQSGKHEEEDEEEAKEDSGNDTDVSEELVTNKSTCAVKRKAAFASIVDESGNTGSDMYGVADGSTNSSLGSGLSDSLSLLTASQVPLNYLGEDMLTSIQPKGDKQQATGSKPEPLVGPGNANDLMMLDYKSQQIVDEIVSLATVSLEDVGALNQLFQRLEVHANLHKLLRQGHFTRQLFLTEDQRPADVVDLLSWTVSQQRINVATFLLLVFRPQAMCAELVSKKLPNREHRIISIGLKAAIQAFFLYIVPNNMRGQKSQGLLAELQIQQLVMEASSDKQLQQLVTQWREQTDEDIAKDLSEDHQDSSELLTFVQQYRRRMSRRLSRLSGGLLRKAQESNPLHILWKSVSMFVKECADTWEQPQMLQLNHTPSKEAEAGADEDELESDNESLSTKDLSDGEKEEKEAEEEVEQQNEAGTEEEEEEEPARGSFSAFVEIDNRPSPDQTPSPSPLRVDTPVANGNVVAKRGVDTGTIDSSFSEARKMARLIRDITQDAHLEDLLDSVSAEPILISSDQLELAGPQRMQHNIEKPTSEDVVAEDRPVNNDTDDFRLEFGGEDDLYDRLAAVKNEDAADEEIQPEANDTTTVAGQRRQRSNSESDYHEITDEEDGGASNIVGRVVATSRTKDGRRRITSWNSRDWAANESDARRKTGNITQHVMGQSNKPSLNRPSFSQRGRRQRRDVEFTPTPTSNNRIRVPIFPQQHGEDGLSQQQSDRLGQYRPNNQARHANDNDNQDDGDEEEEDVDDSYHTAAADMASRANGRLRKPIQRRRRWTEDEVECLTKALMEHGPSWTYILQLHGEDGIVNNVLCHRTRFQLKDKARNIKIRLERDNMDLGPFQMACGSWKGDR